MQIDWKFYGVAAAILAVLVTWFYLAKRDIQIHEGRDVQALLEVQDLDSDEHFVRQAKNYVANLEKTRNIKLTPKQRQRAIDIYAVALQGRKQAWVDDRLKGKTSSETNRVQSKIWQEAYVKFNAMLQETAE